MNTLPSGFRLSKTTPLIHRSANSQVYQGTFNNKDAILKIYPFEYPPESVKLSYQQDHHVGSLLYDKYPENFSEPLEFVNESNKLYLIKRYEGVSLSHCIEEHGRMSVDVFLKTAIEICQNLHLIHEQNIVHCDIKPQNILHNEKNDKTIIIDFESSFLVSLKNSTVPKAQRGTYLYMSPEQTGRTTSFVDKTSDIYSLGITFFQLLTGQVPFEGDLTQVVYAHIAKQAPRLQTIVPSIPKCIEDIILKMIKKNQNERYFSIIGVKKELEFIYKNLTNQKILTTFKAGQLDVDDIFKFKYKVYGRENEIELLKKRLEFVQENNKVELSMICGSSGIGKSRLVDEILIKENNHLIFTGKFDQFQKSTPYSAFIQILKKLFSFLSLKSKEELNQLKKEISSKLEERAKIITNLIPESEYILGENLSDLIEMPSEQDEQKRFVSSIIDLFKYFSSNGMSLSLFLDDLQWADPPSLSLIEQILNEKNIKLFIIGAYRDNEVSETHPLITILQPILNQKNFITVHLKNLNLKYIEEFLSDSLKSKDIKKLAELIFKKTNGNPFFMKEFTLTLYDKKFIKFDYSNEKWSWNLKEISNTKFSDNVVDFMVENLNEYSETTKHILSIASCIGNTFTIELLCMVYEKSTQETYKDLLIPITLGWIYQKEKNYIFVHDRLQQAAYEIFKDKKKIHLKIGQKFLENAKKQNEIESFIFDIVNNLNEASDIFEDKNELISLNLIASKVAAKNYAFEPALKFSGFAKSLLTNDTWDSNHDLTYKTFHMHANNFFLLSRLDEATEVYQELMKNSKTNFELLKAIVSYTKLLVLVANFGEAINLIFELFSKYDVSKNIPKENNEEFTKWSTDLVNELLDFIKGKETAKSFLESIPEKADEEMSLLSRYMLQSSSAFYQTCQAPFAVATQLIGVKIAIMYGNNEYLPAILAALSWYAQIHFRTKEPAIFGKIALDLVKTSKSPNVKLYVSFYLGTSAIFDSNCSSAIKQTEYGYIFGFQIGEFNWGSYSCYCWMNFNISNGCNFISVQNKSIAALKAVYNAKHPFIGDMMASSLQTMNIITEKSNTFDPEYVIPGFVDLPFGRYNHFSQKGISLYLLQDYQEAREALDILQKYPNENIGLPHHYDDNLYSILVDFKLYEERQDESIIDRMKKTVDLIKSFAEQNPIYFQSRYLLAQGILKSIKNDNSSYQDTVSVFELLDRSASDAAQNGSTWIEALAMEFGADFCSKTTIFKEYSKYLYLQAYLKWQTMGVLIKCNRLKLFARKMSFTSSIGGTTTTTSSDDSSTGGNGFGVDIQTIIKSSNTVSEDLDKKKLLTKLNQVIVENAGATRGFIILKSKNEKYIVESEFSDDKRKLNQNSKFIEMNCDFLSFSIFNQCLNQKNMIFYHNAVKEENFKQDLYIQKNSIKSVLCAPIIKGKHLSGILYLENNSMEGAFTESKKFILKHVLSQVAISIENSNLFEDVKTINEAYERFLPKEFLNLLEKKDVRNIKSTDSVQKKMTILFSDIRNFTSITDKMDASESFKFVNDILSEIAPTISSNHGFVDKFIGDCIMAIFPGSPLDGVKAGVEMMNSLKKLNKNLGIPINIGVGISYGNVMIGTLGYEKRLDATVISNTVNTASRMESLTKTLGVSIVITKEIYNEIKTSPELICYSLGSFYLKGQQNSKELFEVVSSLKKDIINIEQFSKGIELFKKKKFKQSINQFKSIKGSFGIIDYYIKVCELYNLNELPPNWNGEIKISKDGDPLQIVSNVEKISIDKIEFIQQMMNDPNQLDYLFESALKLKK